MILVAGGSGFIGSHLVARLKQTGQPVKILSRATGGDVTKPETLPPALEGVDTIIQCVQFPNHPVEKPSRGYTYEKVDGEGTRNLVDAAVKAGGVRRYLYFSGAGTREGRTDLDRMPWFRAKLMAEKAIRESGIPYTVLRPSWIYGPGDRTLNKFAAFARWLPFVPLVGNGKNRVQPLFIDDVAEIVSRTLANPVAVNKIYEIGGPESLTMDEIVRKLLRALGKRRLILHSPVLLVKVAAWFLDFLPRPPLNPQAVDFVMMEELVDNSALISDLGVSLTPMDAALVRYLSH